MQFILGEKREVAIQITSVVNEPFTIRNAMYSLIQKGESSAEDSGICTVLDKKVSALLQPQTDSLYILEFTYEIANEILKATVPIEVKRYAHYY